MSLSGNHPGPQQAASSSANPRMGRQNSSSSVDSSTGLLLQPGNAMLRNRANSPSPSGSRRRTPSPVASDILERLASVQRELERQKTQRVKRKRDEDKEKKLKIRWFPWLLLVLLANVAFWASLTYQVADIAEYGTNHKAYQAKAWIIFAVPVTVGFLGIFGYWRIPNQSRELLGEWKPPARVLALLNALVCLFCSAFYMWFNALPTYYAPEWNVTSSYQRELSPPAFAVVGGYNDPAMADFVTGHTVCTFPSWVNDSSHNCAAGTFSTSPVSLLTANSNYGELQAYIFDGTIGKVGAPSDRLLLQTWVSYNSTKMNDSYQESGLQTPYLFVAVYDPRVNLSDAIDCGLIGLTEIPALASNTFTTTVSWITDEWHMVSSTVSGNTTTANGTACQDVYASALNQEEGDPYASYAFHVTTAAISDPNVCDIVIDPAARCVSQVLLRYQSHVVEAMESVPGVEWFDMLLNVAAIVGGIQFFFWFLAILNS